MGMENNESKNCALHIQENTYQLILQSRFSSGWFCSKKHLFLFEMHLFLIENSTCFFIEKALVFVLKAPIFDRKSTCFCSKKAPVFVRKRTCLCSKKHMFCLFEKRFELFMTVWSVWRHFHIRNTSYFCGAHNTSISCLTDSAFSQKTFWPYKHLTVFTYFLTFSAKICIQRLPMFLQNC
jgi:hypothetical protein